jgi:hypothetical protein
MLAGALHARCRSYGHPKRGRDVGASAAAGRTQRTSEQTRGIFLSCLPKQRELACLAVVQAQRCAAGADDAPLRDDTNRRQFHAALLEDCSFFAHLVLRHVRAGGNRNSPLKKRNVAKVSQTLPRPSSDILLRHLPVEERALQPEAPLSSLQTLWVEVGCRHAQTLVSEKERHEYRENAKPAL